MRRLRRSLVFLSRPSSSSSSGSGAGNALAASAPSSSSPSASSSAAAAAAAASASSSAAAADAAASFPGVSGAASPAAGAAAPGALMVAMYTCRVCETRSARRVSRAAYERGSVLLRCPGCRGLHVLSDHLGYFDDAAVDAAALLEARGEVVRRGALPAGAGAGAGDSAAADEHVVELTADDVRVLRAASKGVRLADGAELPVVPMGPDVLR